MQNGIQIVRCFKCQKFGHISAKCQSAEKCGHCSENHLFRDCPNKNQDVMYTSSNYKQLWNLGDWTNPLLIMANKNLPFIRLNIGGVAEHSKLTFNNYLETHKPTICCLNETKRQQDKDFAADYFTESTCRGVRSDGVAIIISKDLSYTRLNELELKDYDSIWNLTVVAGVKIVIGTVYLKPNETALMEKFIKQREKVANFYHQHNLDGVLFLGHCNVRHCSWGDNICKPNGYLLLESLSAEDNILNNGEATSLSSNGSSVIDLCIVSGQITTQVDFELTTDPNIEQFTEAPQRGHIPLTVKCNLNRTTEEGNTKPWLQKADWEACQNVLEESSHASVEAVQCPNAIDQRGSVLFDITEATRLAILFKRSSRHSKRFWSEDLSQKSAELRAFLKKTQVLLQLLEWRRTQ